MTRERYIKKSCTVFRKEFKNHRFVETKKDLGKKKISVFFDFSILNDITDIPTDVKCYLMQSVSSNMGIINAVSFGNCFISNQDELKYYVDMDGITYNIINEKNGKIIYSVIKIRSVRFAAYDKNIYGYYGGLPYKTNEYNWCKEIGTPIYDLYYIAS